MRLSQLARKLGVTHSDIIKYVESLDTSISLTVHSKIEDSLLEEIKNQFDPTGEKFQEQTPDISEIAGMGLKEVADSKENESSTGENEETFEATSDLDESLQAEAADLIPSNEEIEIHADETVINDQVGESNLEESKVTDENIVSKIKTAFSESEELISADSSSLQEDESQTFERQLEDDSDNQSIDTDRYSEDDSAVIRAKLVKLEGIKIIGKIDLPPPKPKAKEDKDQDAEAGFENTKSNKGRKSRRNHKSRKPESLKQKQEREKRKLERKRKAEEKKIKAKKKQHYIEKLGKAQGSKPLAGKNTKSQKRKAAENRKPMVQKSKNPVKRFWHWLNGKYDQY